MAAGASGKTPVVFQIRTQKCHILSYLLQRNMDPVFCRCSPWNSWCLGGLRAWLKVPAIRLAGAEGRDQSSAPQLVERGVVILQSKSNQHPRGAGFWPPAVTAVMGAGT